jgi:Phage Tail Collar Domain
MKRAPFIGATAAVFLAGCGGHHVMRALPGVAPSSAENPNPTAGRVVPDAADPIPANVLAAPMIGEFRRFDGTTAPSGWAFAQGQTFTAADNPRLFSLLGNLTGDGRTMFRLPKPQFAAIIAIAGTFPTAPAMLSASGRHMSRSDSLGPNAMLPPVRATTISKKMAAELEAQRRLQASAVRVGRAFAVPVSSELAARYARAHEDARSAALEALGAESRARLTAAVEATVSGRAEPYAVVAEMLSSLTNDEANALLKISDTMIRPFNDRATEARSEYARNDAAYFLASVAFTPEQLRAVRRIERSRL